jgi:hypothetical protein
MSQSSGQKQAFIRYHGLEQMGGDSVGDAGIEWDGLSWFAWGDAPNGAPNDGAWMNDLARRRGVQVAMIYGTYLPAPPDWIKVAELHLNMRIITPAHGIVSIFVLDPGLLASVVDGLRRLQVTLPVEASLRILV